MAPRCGHCGREGTLQDLGQVLISERHEEHRLGGGYIEDVVIENFAQIQRCPSCEGLTLRRYMWVDGHMEPADVSFDVLYPEVREVADLPERVQKHYAKMLELQFEPFAFAVSAGKLLEAVCTDQGIPQDKKQDLWDLYDRLEALVERADVPKVLVDQAHLVRRYRNIGGHDDDIEVEEADVPLIRGFVEALLTLLYWGPEELARANAALAERRKAAAKGA